MDSFQRTFAIFVGLCSITVVLGSFLVYTDDTLQTRQKKFSNS